MQHIYAMRTALDMIAEEGLESDLGADMRVFADAVRAAVDAWSADDGGLEFNIIDPAHRSDSTTTVLSGSIDSRAPVQGLRRRRRTDDRHWSGGLRRAESFRIGHMGHLNPTMVLGTLATIEAALGSMEAPVGRVR